MPRFLITTLAEYQTRFWLQVGKRLRETGHDAAFLSFDDRSTEMLRAEGLTVFPATAAPSTTRSAAQLEAQWQAYGLTDLNHWFGHERFAFGVRDSVQMRHKLAAALECADLACTQWSAGGPFSLVQELGGFLSVIGSYFAARHRGIDNWFLEPSFFRGRMFFLRNSFAALPVREPAQSVSNEVDAYLDETIRRGAIVVPLKDRHQYTTAWKKVVNTRNARRLMEKLVDKHLHGKKQEFGHIGSHVATHARMLWSSYRLSGHYTPLQDCPRFVYYPLHVPGDMALTLRTPHLLDQLALIDYLCRAVPATHCIAIKEHPAMVGAIDADRVLDLLRRYDNLVLLPPSTNNYEVLARADAVVSINSKSGAEAALLGKPVLVLGDAFYRESPIVTAVERVQDIPARLKQALDVPRRVDQSEIRRYFSAVWERSLPGELYVPESTNVVTFCNSMVTATSAPATTC